MKLSDLAGLSIFPTNHAEAYPKSEHVILMDAVASNRIFTGIASHHPNLICPLCGKSNPIFLESKVVKLEALLDLNGQDKSTIELFLQCLKLLAEEHGMDIYPKVET